MVAILAELAAPHSALVAAARPWLTMLQGAWWMATAHIMYTSAPAWDPDLMGAPQAGLGAGRRQRAGACCCPLGGGRCAPQPQHRRSATAPPPLTRFPRCLPLAPAGGMMVPVPFVLLALGIAFAQLLLFLGVAAVAQRRLGGAAGDARHLHARLPTEDSALDTARVDGGDVELAQGLKLYAAASHDHGS